MTGKSKHGPRNSRLTLFCLQIAIILVMQTEAWAQETEMSLHLQATKEHYVVREPIKFVAVLTNESDRVLKIFPPDDFNMNMEHMYFEITLPNGEVQKRKFRYYSATSYTPSYYLGEPLAPGKSLVMFLYPNESYLLKESGYRGEYEVTFPEPGTYSVRLIYFVPMRLKHLWKGEEGKLYSNAVELDFRAPDPVEKEILDAYWANTDREFISIGDDHPYCCSFNKTALRSVIRKYPDSPFIKYAYFALAKVLSKLTRKTTDAMQNEAIGIFELLMERFPSFRYEEVRLILARDYYNTGRKRDAVYLFNKLLSERPYLKDNKNFINEKIFAEEGNVKAIAEWWRNNRAGIDKDKVHIRMEE